MVMSGDSASPESAGIAVREPELAADETGCTVSWRGHEESPASPPGLSPDMSEGDWIARRMDSGQLALIRLLNRFEPLPRVHIDSCGTVVAFLMFVRPKDYLRPEAASRRDIR